MGVLGEAHKYMNSSECAKFNVGSDELRWTLGRDRSKLSNTDKIWKDRISLCIYKCIEINISKITKLSFNNWLSHRNLLFSWGKSFPVSEDWSSILNCMSVELPLWWMFTYKCLLRILKFWAYSYHENNENQTPTKTGLTVDTWGNNGLCSLSYLQQSCIRILNLFGVSDRDLLRSGLSVPLPTM